MASKFMIDSALGARLLLHQRTVSFGIIYKLGCSGRPMWPLVLGSRAYSGSSLTPPLPKDQSSQPSKYGGKDRFYENWDRISPWLKGGAKLLATGGIGLLTYATKEFWIPDWYRDHRRVRRESARESAIHKKLKKGPEFPQDIQAAISRESLIDEVKTLITATETSTSYPLIVGEHGTGKTSLIQLAIMSMDQDKPKGIAYVDLPLQCHSQADLAVAIQDGLGWNLDPVLDSNKPVSVRETLKFFSRAALKYQQKYNQVPVLIIDNVNRLAQNKQELLDLLQDYAKSVTDRNIATVVFVSSEGCVPRRMTKRSTWSRSGDILEVDDMSKEEALEFLKLRELNKEQAAEIYELVGGRIIHLKNVADAIKKRNSVFQVIRKKMFDEAEIELQNADMFPGDPYHEEAGVIIRELLKRGSISSHVYRGLVDVSLGKKFLETNVFALHPNSKTVTFQSTVMKRFCEENSALWKGK